MVRFMRPDPEALDILERNSRKTRGPGAVGSLEAKRVLVVGLGPIAEYVTALTEQGIGSAPGGSVRLLPLPGEHEAGLELGHWLAGNVPGLQFEERSSPEILEEAIKNCDVVVDAGHFLDAALKCQLYRAARRHARPLITVQPTVTGATAYFFHPDSPVSFEELFSVPQESLRKGWRLPLSRLLFQDDAETEFRMFQLFNGLVQAPLHPLAREATRLLLLQMVMGVLQGKLLPQAPVACYLEPQQFLMGTHHVGQRIAEQAESIWTRIAGVYDEFLLGAEQNVYLELVGKIRQDLGGCERVLEAGCGTGSICQALALAGVDAYGIDRNLAMLARASYKAAHTPGMYVGEGDVHKLYFPDEFFDGYCSNNVVFDADIVLTLREAHRVLRLGGKLAIASSQMIPKVEALGAVPSYFEKLDPVVAREFVACQHEIYAGRSLKYGFQTHGASRVEELLRQTGFSRILKSETVFAGHSFYLVAEKCQEDLAR